jgi:peptidyl-prolyl cis-trans isomerase C
MFKSKISLIIIFIGLATSILFMGCPKNEPAIATVGSAKLTKRELAVQIPATAQVTQENLSALIDKWINTELIYQEAQRRKIDKDETLQVQLKQVEKEMVVNKLLEQEMGKITVSRQEIFDYFTKHKDDFMSEVKISRIVVYEESLANKVLAELRTGADFKTLAQDVSQDRVLEKGAESKYFAMGVGDPRQGGDPGLEEAIFALNIGQISDVIKSQEGYQIVKLVDKRKVKKDIALADVEDYINSILQYRKSREMLDTIIANLKTKTKVTENPNLFFK